MKKRILPALLALCMVMSLLPVSVFATETTENVALSTVADQSTITGNKSTLHKRTCTVAAAECTCVVKTTPETGDPTYKWGDSLCTACSNANCGTAVQQEQPGDNNNNNDNNSNQPPQHSDPNCALKDSDPNHSGPHMYACYGCTLGASCPYSKHYQQNSGCTELVSEYQTICVGCKAEMAAKAAQDAATAQLPENRDCQANANDNAQRTNCQKDTHETTCANKCDDATATGCTLTKGHTGKHNDTSNCTKNDQCGATANHDDQCPNWTAPAAQNNKLKGQASHVFKVSTTCTQCPNSNLHDHDLHPGVVVSGKHTSEAFYVEVTGYKVYEYSIVYKKDANGQDTSEIDEAKTKAAGEAAAKGIDWTQESAPTVPDEDKVCEYCKAANAAKADVDESKAYAKCDMTAECQKDAPDPTVVKHNDDCLSLCTMSNACKNTAGDANAHVVKYRYIKTTVTYKNVEKDAQSGEVTNEGVVDDETPATTETQDFLSYAEAQAYLNNRKATTLGSVTNANKQEHYSYVIRTVHCPKSGGVDSTVLTVEADGTTTETPETPDKPTKAEDFTDVVDWMVEGVQFMLDKGWMEGMGDGTFGVAKTLKTTQVLTVLARMNGETITGSTWEEDAKAWAEKNAEMFDGIDLTAPSIARKDVVLALWRQAGKPEPSADFELEFTDVDGLEGDHLTAMKWAVENGIVKGNGDGTVSPDTDINPAQLSLMAMRAFNNK